MLVNAKRSFSLPSGYGDWSSLMVRAYVQGTSNPARTYSQLGTLLNADGRVTLSPNGAMDVWLMDTTFYRLDLYDARTGFVLFTDPEFEPGLVSDFAGIPSGDNVGDILTWTANGPLWKPPTGGGTDPTVATITPTAGSVEFTEDSASASFDLAVANVALTGVVSVTPPLPAGITASVLGTKLRVSGAAASPLAASDYVIVAISAKGFVTYTLTLEILEVAVIGGWVPTNGSEQMYYDPTAYPVQLSQKMDLQNLLDAHNVIRLMQAGDYAIGGLTGLMMKTNQRIYGIPRRTTIPPVTIVPGSSGIVIRALSTSAAGGITFPASPLVTKRNLITNVDSGITSIGGSVEENVIAALLGSVNVDNSAGGTHKSNRYIKPHSILNGWQLGTSPLGTAAFYLKGSLNRKTIDGNVLIALNALGPGSGTLFADGGGHLTVLGWDDETYHPPYNGLAQVYIRNYDKFAMMGSGGSPDNTPIDSGADNTQILYNNSYSAPPNSALKLSTQAKFASWVGVPTMINGDTNVLDQTGGVVKTLWTDAALKMRYNGNGAYPSGATLSGTDLSDVYARIVEQAVPSGKVWARYPQRAIPDPLGPTWNVGLSSQHDESDELQALLDANLEVILEPRAYYINKPLYMREDQSIIGTRNETVIVAMRTDLDMLKFQFGGTRNDLPSPTTGLVNLIDVVLQGGNSGLHQNQAGVQLASHTLAYVTFRDMTTAGIYLDHSYGMDNGWFEYLNFYKCGTAVAQFGSGGVEQPNEMYSDKTPFYRCQFIECGKGLDLNPRRSNNMMSYIECLFKDCTGSALSMGSQNYPVFVNCQFINNGGTTQCDSRNPISFINCLFKASSLNTWIVTQGMLFEGCTFDKNGNDTVTFMDPGRPMWQTGDNVNTVVVNSTSTIPIGTTAFMTGSASLTSINSLWPVSDTGWSAALSHVGFDTKGTPFLGDNVRYDNRGFVAGTVSPGSRLLTLSYDINAIPDNTPYDPANPLARWKSGNSVYGKRVTFLGDSTTAIAPGLFNRLRDQITPAGGEWEGAVVTQLGYNGQTIDGFLDQSFQELVATNPALIVICFGLNNVRRGEYSSADVEALLMQLIERCQEQMPLADIVLWTPNSMLTVDALNFGTVVPVDQAQNYTDRLWNAHNNIKVANPYQHVAYLDKMEVFGRICQATSDKMNDILHPNEYGQRMATEPLIELARPDPVPINLTQSAAAWTDVPATPWLVYARALEDTRYATLKRHMIIGNYTDAGNNVRMVYFFNRREDLTPLTISSVEAGDLIWTPNGVYVMTGSEGKWNLPGGGLQINFPLNQFPPNSPAIGDVRLYQLGAAGSAVLSPDNGDASFVAGDPSKEVQLAAMTVGSLSSVASVTPPLPTGLVAAVVSGALRVSGTTASPVASADYTIVLNKTGGGTVIFTLTLNVTAVAVTVPYVFDVTFNGAPTDVSLTDAKGAVWTPTGGATLDGVVPSGGGFECVSPAVLAATVLGTGDFVVEVNFSTMSPNVTLWDLGVALGLPMGRALNGDTVNPIAQLADGTITAQASMAPYSSNFMTGTPVTLKWRREAGVQKVSVNGSDLFWGDSSNGKDYTTASTKITLGTRQGNSADNPFIGTIYSARMKVGAVS